METYAFRQNHMDPSVRFIARGSGASQGAGSAAAGGHADAAPAAASVITRNFLLVSAATAMSKPTLYVQRLSEAAVLPKRGSALAAGWDLAAAKACVVPAKGRAIVATDLSIATPEDCYARIAPRSGLAVKKFIDVGAGVVDARSERLSTNPSRCARRPLGSRSASTTRSCPTAPTWSTSPSRRSTASRCSPSSEYRL